MTRLRNKWLADTTSFDPDTSTAYPRPIEISAAAHRAGGSLDGRKNLARAMTILELAKLPNESNSASVFCSR